MSPRASTEPFLRRGQSTPPPPPPVFFFFLVDDKTNLLPRPLHDPSDELQECLYPDVRVGQLERAHASDKRGQKHKVLFHVVAATRDQREEDLLREF